MSLLNLGDTDIRISRSKISGRSKSRINITNRYENYDIKKEESNLDVKSVASKILHRSFNYAANIQKLNHENNL